MKFKVLHNMRGRMRIHVMTNEMTDLQADKLEYDLAAQDMILTAKVYERTSDVVITYAGERQLLLSYLQTYYYRRKVEEDETLARFTADVQFAGNGTFAEPTTSIQMNYGLFIHHGYHVYTSLLVEPQRKWLY